MCFIKSFQDLAREFVAFANYQGGMILLGVEYDEKISGILRQNIEEWGYFLVFIFYCAVT